MFFENSLTVRLSRAQSSLNQALSNGRQGLEEIRQQYAALIASCYDELMQNENKTDARAAMINILQMETESAVRLYEVFFRFSQRQDIVAFGDSTREQYDHDMYAYGS